jgi:DNA-directed RNA polymerase subunit RPC12/RpoP
MWRRFFSNYFVFAVIVGIISASMFWNLGRCFNRFVREATLKKIVASMNMYMDPEVALKEYGPCINAWKKIKSPTRVLYRLILNYPLEIWRGDLVEQIGYDKPSKTWKLLGESGNWISHVGLPDEIPIGECTKCHRQIYDDDLEELDAEEMGLVCIDCGARLNFGKSSKLRTHFDNVKRSDDE